MGRIKFVPGVARADSPTVEPAAEVSTVKSLLNQLLDADKDGKTQTVRDLRNKLNELREKLGDEKFKEILKRLAEEADGRLLELLKRLFREWFPDDDDVTPPAPPPRGGGGGGGGGAGVNPQGFGPSEPMNTKPYTSGQNYFNYKPDNSNPGQKPGTGREPGNIWSGFKQGPDGNCVTVSAIKAAMMRYGKEPTDVFKEVKEAGDGYDVTMRDGFKLHVSKGELKEAAKEARFEGDDPSMITSANFMYAASAKRAQMENNDGTAGSSFMAAMKSLNNGEYAREGLDRLGLRGRYRPATDADLRSSRVGTVEYGGHSMAVINGRIELWGRRGGTPDSGIATVLI
jgi:hypothetical protein